MILAFSQKINDKPTYFVHKIWQSLFKDGIRCNARDFSKRLGQSIHIVGEMKVGDYDPKRHTIRKDTSNRWKAGNDIHFCINVRTKDQFQFAPVVKCVSTQKIEIRSCLDKSKPFKVSYNKFLKVVYSTFNHPYQVLIDDRVLDREQTITLAKNDGFDSVEDFFKYFNTDFTGKIIHWTNLKY